jgi:hypothetical protein
MGYMGFMGIKFTNYFITIEDKPTHG